MPALTRISELRSGRGRVTATVAGEAQPLEELEEFDQMEPAPPSADGEESRPGPGLASTGFNALLALAWGAMLAGRRAWRCWR